MKSPIPEKMRGRTVSNIIVVCVGIVVAAAVLHIDRLLAVLRAITRTAMPVLLGFGIAFVMLPSVNRLEKGFAKLLSRRKPHPKLCRALALVIAYVVLLALVAGFFAIVVPQIVRSLRSVVSIVSNAIPRSTRELNDLLERSTLLQRLGIDIEQVMEFWQTLSGQLTDRISELTTYTSVLLNNVIAIAGSISSSVYNVLFHALVGLIASVYMLMDRERFCAQAKKVCYATMKRSTCETLIYWTRRAHQIFAGFINGKIVDSLIIGVLCYVCMLIFGIEYPLLISVIVGVTNVIPFFGPYIGAIPSILFLLLVNPVSALWFLVFIIILQQLDGNVIGPLILGDHVGLSAFWIMLAIIVGGGLFGFAGMVLSVPTFALIYAIVRTVIDKRLREKGLPEATDSYVSAPEDLPAKSIPEEEAPKEGEA